MRRRIVRIARVTSSGNGKPMAEGRARAFAGAGELTPAFASRVAECNLGLVSASASGLARPGGDGRGVRDVHGGRRVAAAAVVVVVAVPSPPLSPPFPRVISSVPHDTRVRHASPERTHGRDTTDTRPSHRSPVPRASSYRSIVKTPNASPSVRPSVRPSASQAELRRASARMVRG